MTIIRLTPERSEAAAAFIAAHQKDMRHCIPYFGESAAEIAQAIAEFTPPHNMLLMLDANNQITGVLGVDISAELNRAWLHGPQVSDPAQADLLYTEAAQTGILPPGVEQELFIDERNVATAAFARRHGFKAAATLELNLRLPRTDDLPTATAETLTPAQYPAFTALHDATFPKTYFSAAQIIERLGERERVLIVREGDALLGYVFARAEVNADYGYIDYLGVAKHARRRGIGRQLTLAAAHWLLQFPQVQTVNLTVSADNTAAVALYDSLGFAHWRRLRVYRRPS